MCSTGKSSLWNKQLSNLSSEYLIILNILLQIICYQLFQTSLENYSMGDKQENGNVIGMPVQNVLLIIIAIGTDIVRVTLVFLHHTMTMTTGIMTMELLFG